MRDNEAEWVVEINEATQEMRYRNIVTEEVIYPDRPEWLREPRKPEQ